MKVTVFGGTGFVGGHLVNLLLERGDDVRCLIRSPSRAQTLREQPVEIMKGDLQDASSLQKAISGCEVVYHVAGQISALLVRFDDAQHLALEHRQQSAHLALPGTAFEELLGQ